MSETHTDPDLSGGLSATAESLEGGEAGIIDSKPSSKRKRAFLIAGSILLVAAVIGTAYWLYTRQFEYTDDAFISGEIVEISPKISAYVKKLDVKDNQFVKKGDLLVELNDDALQVALDQARSQLHAAQALRSKSQAQTVLTHKTTTADVDQARSNVKTAQNNVAQSGLTADSKQAEIAESESAVKTARAELLQARSQVPRAESNLRLAQTGYDRYLSLFKFGTVSRQSLDESQNALELARADLNVAQNRVSAAESAVTQAEARVRTAETNYKQALAGVDSSRSQVDESRGRLKNADAAPERVAVDNADVDSADAEIEKAEVAVRQAELDLSYTKIYAPEDGYITNRNVQEGQLVQPGAALMAIAQTDVWVVANFRETQLEKMRIGQPVDIKVDAFPDRTFRGHVESFQSGTGSAFSLLPSENASGNFVKVVQRVPVKILFDEKPDDVNLLVPGMSVQPRVKVL